MGHRGILEQKKLHCENSIVSCVVVLNKFPGYKK
jgi:hypothetical protein